jgi:hypothetical protein
MLRCGRQTEILEGFSPSALAMIAFVGAGAGGDGKGEEAGERADRSGWDDVLGTAGECRTTDEGAPWAEAEVTAGWR